MKYRIKTLVEMPSEILNADLTRPKNWNSRGEMDCYFGVSLDESQITLNGDGSFFTNTSPHWTFNPREFSKINDDDENKIKIYLPTLGKRVKQKTSNVSGIIVGYEPKEDRYIIARDDSDSGWTITKTNIGGAIVLPDCYDKRGWYIGICDVNFIDGDDSSSISFPKNTDLKETKISAEQIQTKKSIVLEPLIKIKTRVLI